MKEKVILLVDVQYFQVTIQGRNKKAHFNEK